MEIQRGRVSILSLWKVRTKQTRTVCFLLFIILQDKRNPPRDWNLEDYEAYLVQVHSVRCRVPGHKDNVLIQGACVESVFGNCQNLQRNTKESTSKPLYKNKQIGLIHRSCWQTSVDKNQRGKQIKHLWKLDVARSVISCCPSLI